VTTLDVGLVRRYLLGDADDDENSALERQYLDDPEALDAISAAEEDLIEDYLGDRLDANARQRFVDHYLASPAHRARVETIRNLIEAAGRSTAASRKMSQVPSAKVRPGLWRLSIAAAAILATGTAGATWIYRMSHTAVPAPETVPRGASQVETPNRPTPPPAQRALAFFVPAVNLRAGGSGPSLLLSPGIDRVVLSLERPEGTAPPIDARAVIRSLAGEEVWSGSPTAGTLPPDIAARLEVPSGRLRVDDYTISLIGRDARGRDSEVHQYFLRVREQ
jgi:hypothetical protein